jgi:hypothetical protein
VGVVLLDAGLPYAPAPDPDTVIEALVGPAIERLHASFASVADYVAAWRAHPAFARAWNADVEAFARHDAVSDGRAARCVVSEEAVRTDGRDLLVEDATRTALDDVRAPIALLRAPRGRLDDEHPVLTRALLQRFLAAHPDVRFEEVADVNHYTLVLGDSPGPGRVARAIEAISRETTSVAPSRSAPRPPSRAR